MTEMAARLMLTSINTTYEDKLQLHDTGVSDWQLTVITFGMGLP